MNRSRFSLRFHKIQLSTLYLGILYMCVKGKIILNLTLGDLDTQIVFIFFKLDWKFMLQIPKNLNYVYIKNSNIVIRAILNLVLCSRKIVIDVYIIIFLTSYFKQIVDHSLILFLIEIHILKKIKTII